MPLPARRIGGIVPAMLSLTRCARLLLPLLLACDAKTEPVKPKPATPTKASQTAPEPAKKALPEVDAKGLAEGVKSLAVASEDERPLLAARALVILEKDRLGASFIAGIDGLVEADPAYRARIVSQAITENLGMLDAVCGAGSDKFMASLATMAPEQRDEALWERCKFAKNGLIGEAEGKAAEPLAIILAHMAYAHL
ncbi:MAG: hypothetical protein ACPG4T_24235, partial [Nannocystaceae bacterium]